MNVISVPPNAPESATGLLVILHGWGADASDLVPLSSLLDLPGYHYLFPNAPFTHPEVPGGRAWYALESSTYHGLPESRQILNDWLCSLEESTKIPLSQTILAGFSQGGAMTLDVGLSLPLAGLCCLSGYLHSKPQLSSSAPPPVLMVHGKHDLVVPIKAAQQTREELLAHGVTVDYHEFSMGHEIPMPVLSLMQKFINELGKVTK